MQALRFIAFCAYLFAWLVFAVGAAVGAIPRIQEQAAAPIRIRREVIIGTFMQVASLWMITFRLGDGPLHPSVFALVAVAVLAPFGAGLFAWAFRSTRGSAPNTLVTRGAYAWVRHPMYLAFLAMLLATGLLASAGDRLLVAVVVYVAGSELRLDAEEEDLARTFNAEYGQYRRRTRWRYLPGVR